MGSLAHMPQGWRPSRSGHSWCRACSRVVGARMTQLDPWLYAEFPPAQPSSAQLDAAATARAYMRLEGLSVPEVAHWWYHGHGRRIGATPSRRFRPQPIFLDVRLGPERVFEI